MASISGNTRPAPTTSACLATPRLRYPIEWAKSEDTRICGARQRAELPRAHGLHGLFVGGGAFLRTAGERNRHHANVAGIDTPYSASITMRPFNQTTHLQYQPWKKGPWFGFNWRYDSGLVAGPVPCIGGNCANGPNGTDSDSGCIRPDAGSAVPSRTVLRERARHSHHADQLRLACAQEICTDQTW